MIADALRPSTGMARVLLSETEFWFSHSRAPKGRGSWAFEIANGSLPPVPRFYPSSTFSEARSRAVADVKLACAIFGVGGEIVLNVCP